MHLIVFQFCRWDYQMEDWFQYGLRTPTDANAAIFQNDYRKLLKYSICEGGTTTMRTLFLDRSSLTNLQSFKFITIQRSSTKRSSIDFVVLLQPLHDSLWLLWTSNNTTTIVLDQRLALIPIVENKRGLNY